MIVTIIAARINTAIRYTLAILADTKKAAVIANMSENGARKLILITIWKAF